MPKISTQRARTALSSALYLALCACTIAQAVLGVPADLRPLAIGLFAYLALEIASSNRLILGSGVALIGLGLLAGGPAPLALLMDAAVRTLPFLVLFLAVLCLQGPALASPTLRSIGGFVAEQPPGQRFLGIALAGHVLGAVLNVAGLLLVLSLRDPKLSPGDQIRLTAGAMRGFGAAAAWSPLFVAMSVVLAVLPGLSWFEIAGRSIIAAMAIIALAWLWNRIERGRPAATRTGPRSRLAPATLLIPSLDDNDSFDRGAFVRWLGAGRDVVRVPQAGRNAASGQKNAACGGAKEPHGCVPTLARNLGLGGDGIAPRAAPAREALLLPSNGSLSSRFGIRAGLILCMLFVPVIALFEGYGLSIPIALGLVAPAVAGLWQAAQSPPGRRPAEVVQRGAWIFSSLPGLRNEALLFFAANAFGLGLSQSLDAASLEQLTAALPTAQLAIPALIMGGLLLAGIGVHPIVIVVAVGNVLTPEVLRLSEIEVALSLLVVWGMGAIMSPFSGTVLQVARLTNASPFVVAWRWNARFCLAIGLPVSAVVYAVTNF